MEKYIVNDRESAQEFITFLEEEKPKYTLKNNIVTLEESIVEIDPEFKSLLARIKPQGAYSNKLIYGKDKTENITSVEISKDIVYIYYNDGTFDTKPMIYWVLTPKPYDKYCKRLDGNQHYKYIRKFNKHYQFSNWTKKLRNKDLDFFTIWNNKESALVYYGITMFKGLKVKDVSILSFDIEAEGLKHHKDSKVFLITNTFRDSSGKIIKKHFRVDHYNGNDGVMIKDWCDWVNSVDPVIFNGHNIFGYDLPYLQYCYEKSTGKEEGMPLGKNGTPMTINKNSSKFRVDGNNEWEYKKMHIPGRHIIDGMFLAVKYDIGRKYVSWGLKQIAEQEGIVKSDRQFYDASKIGQNWSDPIEREKIITYGIDDSDDSLALYDIMIPSLFYMTQSVPKPFQNMGTSASGAQLNAVMIRAYLQDGKSIPKASEREYVAGGMSHGIPGKYDNVTKWDAKSYYPSTILKFNIYDPEKDPDAKFLEMVRHFTYKRFEQKGLYKETKDKYYDDLQAASKVFINSAYGLLGTSGLNFNSFHNAKLITRCCRGGLQKAILWATGLPISHWWPEYYKKTTSNQDFKDFSFIDKKSVWSVNDMPRHDWILVNLDTDSLSFCKKNMKPFTDDELKLIQDELNKIMYSEWEDDGIFKTILVVKAKNYVLLDSDNKIKKKGSSLTDTKKEPALVEFLDKCIKQLIYGEDTTIVDIYHEYIREVKNIKDISRWTTKKSITSKVLNPDRTNEQRVLDAIWGKNLREGDKVWIYTAIDQNEPEKPVIKNRTTNAHCPVNKNLKPKMETNTILKCQEDWKSDHHMMHYITRVYSTLKILSPVIDFTQIIKYDNKREQSKLEEL